MEITINEKDGRLVASLIGDLDNSASSMAEKELAPLLERDDCDIELDCRELDYISSSGLRILLNIYKSTRRNGRIASRSIKQANRKPFSRTPCRWKR